MSEVLACMYARAYALPEYVALQETIGRTWSCRELWHEVTVGAEALQAIGVQPGDAVLLDLPRSGAWVIGLLAAWQAGAVPVLGDSMWPTTRAREAIAVAGVRAILAVSVREALGDAAVLDVSGWQKVPTPSDLAPHRAWLGSERAYVVFSSGSTGRPKAIALGLAGLFPMWQSQITAFGVGLGDRVLWLLAPAFDASLSDVGVALLAGATLVVATGEPIATLARVAALVAEHGITHVDLPPVVLRSLDPELLPACLNTVVVGGEASAPAVLRAWAKRVRVIAVYGPAEATVCASLAQVDSLTWRRPSIGQPLDNMTFSLRNLAGRELSGTAEGELWIAGPGVAEGYIGDPELTNRRFVVRDGRRWYRTGDLIRRDPDHALIYLGRCDRQVKVHGQLLAPEEVEACLLEQPGVVATVVGLDSRGILVAVVAGLGGTQSLDIELLREALGTVLARWMVPRFFHVVASLPRLASGKVDTTAALAQVPQHQRRRPGRTLPGERQMLSLWQEVLGRTPHRDDHWYDLGGDSLAAIRLLAAADRVGLSLAAGDLHLGATPAGLAARCGERNGAQDARSGMWLQSDITPTTAQRMSWRRAATRPPAVPLLAARRVLLTGATGQLGAHALVWLLRKTQAEVVCLVRATDPHEGRIRVLAAAARQDTGLQVQDDIRIKVVCGDIEQPGLGLDASTWDEQATTVDVIVHCAAAVDLLRPYQSLRPVLVEAVIEIGRLSAEGRSKHLVYASTLALFALCDRPLGRHEPDVDLDPRRVLFGGYAQGKWAAEAFLRQAASPLGAITVARLGLLVGPAPPTNDWLAIVLKGLVRLGCLPNGDPGWRFDTTPVRRAAHTMLEFAGRRPVAQRPQVSESWRVCHVAGNPGGLDDLAAGLGANGHVLERVPLRTFRSRLDRFASTSAEGAVVRLAFARAYSRSHAHVLPRPTDLFLATGIDFTAKDGWAGLTFGDCPTSAEVVAVCAEATLARRTSA